MNTIQIILLTLYVIGIFITPIIYLNMSFSLRYTPINNVLGLTIRCVLWPLAIIERMFFW